MKFQWLPEDRSVDESLEEINNIIRLYPTGSVRIYVDLANTLGVRGTPEQIDAYVKLLDTHGGIFFKDGLTADLPRIAITAGLHVRWDVVKHVFRTYPLNGEAVVDRAIPAFSTAPVGTLITFCDLAVAELEYDLFGFAVVLLRSSSCSYEVIESTIPELFDLPDGDLVMMTHVIMHTSKDVELIHACLSRVDCSVETFGAPLDDSRYAIVHACVVDASREPLLLSALLSRNGPVIEAVLSYCTQEVKSARYKDMSWTDHYLGLLRWSAPDPHVIAMLATITKGAIE